MAFPADYTLLGTLEVPSLAGATASDVPLRLKFEDFSTAMLASLDTGGGDLRISSDISGATRLPLDVVSFTKVSGGVQVQVKVPSVSSSTLIYIWGNNTGDTQPAVGAAFGRNAVWVDYEIAAHLNETSGSTAIDSAGKRDGTYGGLLPVAGANFGQDFDGVNDANSDRVNFGNTALGITSGFSFHVQIRADSTGTAQQVFTADDTNSNIRCWQWRVDAGGKVRIIGFNSGGSIVFNSAGTATVSANTTYNLDFTWDGATYKSYIDGVVDYSFSSATALRDLGTGNGANVGSRVSGGSLYTESFNGQIGELNVVSGSALSLDFINIRNSNQSSVGAWFTAADAGGAITVTATLGAITYAGQPATVGITGSVDVTATLGTISYTSQASTVSITGGIDVNATLGAIDYASYAVTVGITGSVDVIASLGTINYAGQSATVSIGGVVSVSATVGAINYTSHAATVDLFGVVAVNAALGAISYTSSNTTVDLAGLIGISATLGTITYNDYNTTVNIANGQTIGVVTTSFANDLYSSSFKPNSITVTFRS